MSPVHDDEVLPTSREVKRNPASVRSKTSSTFTEWVSYILKPSILSRAPRQIPNATSYIDGIRGLAALLVYIQNHQLVARFSHPEESSQIFFNAYGYHDQYHFACLPFIRLFFSGGDFAVAIFFVISGSVLSARPLEMIHKRDFRQLYDVLASALFRRWTRLYLPVALTTLGYATAWHVLPLKMSYPTPSENWFVEVVRWTWQFRIFSFLWSHQAGITTSPIYNINLWTIPIEFRGSIVIFTTLMAFSKCRKNARLFLAGGLVLYFLICTKDGGAYYAMFLSGLLIRDFEILSSKNDLPSFVLKATRYVSKGVFFPGLFVIGLYLGGVPSLDFSTLNESPGWSYISLLSPSSVDYKWFYLSFAASFVVIAIPHLYIIRKILESRICQYLGHISFALYLIHGPILWTLGDRLYLAVGWTREFNIEGLEQWIDLFPVEKTGPLGLELAFWLPHLVLLPLTLWMAEIVMRLCDGPSIRLSQWMYKKSSEPSELNK